MKTECPKQLLAEQVSALVNCSLFIYGLEMRDERIKLTIRKTHPATSLP